MRIIPVIDLLEGQAVHAVKGNRADYRPLKSVLCETAEPLAVAAAFRDRLGLTELYIADLNAIQSRGQTPHRDLIASLARGKNLSVLLDAGASEPEDARAWLDLGIRKAIFGAETVHRLRALQEIPEKVNPDQLVFSLDMRAGRTLSRSPDLASLSPIQVLGLLRSAGWHEVILLDLCRVGSEGGVDHALAVEARAKYPELSILVGGGIANPEQLAQLESVGISGVLVSTALHRGTITARHFLH